MNPILPNDIFSVLAKEFPNTALSVTNKDINRMVNKIYDDASQSITKELPSLNNPPEITNKVRRFTELIDNLHAESKRLNGEKPTPSDLSTEQKILQSYFEFRDLVQEVLTKTDKAKKEDLGKFVLAIAEELGITINPGANLSDKLLDFQAQHLLEGVVELNLNEKGLKFLPPEIALLTHLKDLYLDMNHIKSLPSELNSLSNLERITANNNNIETIPADLRLPLLRRLELRHNDLTKAPDLDAYPVLESIFLHSNAITEIPPNVDDHPTLQTIYLKNNPIKKVPDDLSDRVVLNISENQNELAGPGHPWEQR